MHKDSEEKTSPNISTTSSLQLELKDCKTEAARYLQQLDLRRLPPVIKKYANFCSALTSILENYCLALDEYANVISITSSGEQNRFTQAHSQILNKIKATWTVPQLMKLQAFSSSFTKSEAFAFAKNFTTYFRLTQDALDLLKTQVVPVMKEIATGNTDGKPLSPEANEVGKQLSSFIKRTTLLLRVRSDIHFQCLTILEYDYNQNIEQQIEQISLATSSQKNLVAYFSSNYFRLIPSWCHFLQNEPLGEWCIALLPKVKSLESLLRTQLYDPVFPVSNYPPKISSISDLESINHLNLSSLNVPTVHPETRDLAIHLCHYFTHCKPMVLLGAEKLIAICEPIRQYRESLKSEALNRIISKIRQEIHIISDKNKYKNLSETNIYHFIDEASNFIIKPDQFLTFNELFFLQHYNLSNPNAGHSEKLSQFLTESTWYFKTFIENFETISQSCLKLKESLEETDTAHDHLHKRTKGFQLILLLALDHLKSDRRLDAAFHPEEVIELDDFYQYFEEALDSHETMMQLKQ